MGHVLKNNYTLGYKIVQVKKMYTNVSDYTTSFIHQFVYNIGTVHILNDSS